MSARAVFLTCPILEWQGGEVVQAMQDSYKDSPPLAPYLLRSLLERSGRPCALIDWVAQHGKQAGGIAVEAANYDVVFFSANSMNWASARLLASEIRAVNPSAKLCIGGPHPTLYPDSVAKSGLFDAYFRGEGDKAIPHIYDALLHESVVAIDGYCLCGNGTHPSSIYLESDLDSLDPRVEFPDLIENTYHAIPAQSSRGCNQSCLFCSIADKKHWRSWDSTKSVQAILTSASASNRCITDVVSLVDDNFTVNHQRSIDICNELEQCGFRNRMICDTTLRALLDDKLLEALIPVCADVLVGAEVTTIADAKQIRKDTSPELIQTAAKAVHQAGFSSRCVFSFIIGFPWQTKQDCLDEFRFIAELILSFGIRVYLQWYWPMPGSRLWGQLETQGRISLETIDSIGFFRERDWFYGCRQLTEHDVRAIDEYIRPVQLCLNIYSEDRNRTLLEYCIPRVLSDST